VYLAYKLCVGHHIHSVSNLFADLVIFTRNIMFSSIENNAFNVCTVAAHSFDQSLANFAKPHVS